MSFLSESSTIVNGRNHSFFDLFFLRSDFSDDSLAKLTIILIFSFVDDSVKVQIGESLSSYMTGNAITIIEPPVLLRSRESGRWVQEEEDVMPYSGLFYFI